MRRVCADTGFLIALYGEQGDQHDRASTWFEQLFARPGHQLLLPWPALYEAINTRLAKAPRQLEVMERDWTLLHRNGRLDYLSDEPYREDALAQIFAETQRPRPSYRPLSLADLVIRALLADVALRVDVLLTNDESAFHDICRIRNLEMISILRAA